MRCLLLLTTAWALAPISTPPKRTEFREGIGGATKEQAISVGDTVECAKKPIGPRDVIINCYDISSDGQLAPALSLATMKKVHWFPKLTCSVGDRAWAYDKVHKSNCRGASPPLPNHDLHAMAGTMEKSNPRRTRLSHGPPGRQLCGKQISSPPSTRP